MTVEGKASVHDDPLRQGFDIDLGGGEHSPFLGFIPSEDML